MKFEDIKYLNMNPQIYYGKQKKGFCIKILIYIHIKQQYILQKNTKCKFIKKFSVIKCTLND